MGSPYAASRALSERLRHQSAGIEGLFQGVRQNKSDRTRWKQPFIPLRRDNRKHYLLYLYTKA
jgi:hypothetical protein